ncbi:hypothetical protein DFR50_101107 [Roseiarcus fermentans]|uniref:Uncharacterized protein n=2 Tax=Roseiarcus fermentans TaxID=1473586 RepID=A0A366FU02_9HYPH|nr:hypothetical protein DFR50_101107 [Roseiarcus fermentans]
MYGTWTPQQAEEWAQSRRLPPFAEVPDPAKFDPLQELYCTLSMALIWVASRDINNVREAWSEWWEVHKGWRENHPQGWTLGPLKRPTDHTTFERFPLDPRSACKQLWAAHITGKIVSTGINDETRIRRVIRQEEWCDLKSCDGYPPEVVYLYDDLCSNEWGRGFRRVLVSVDELVRAFPADEIVEGRDLQSVLREALADSPNLTFAEAFRIVRARGLKDKRDKIRDTVKYLGGIRKSGRRKAPS